MITISPSSYIEDQLSEGKAILSLHALADSLLPQIGAQHNDGIHLVKYLVQLNRVRTSEFNADGNLP
jgi:hypothetical protein